MSAEERPSALVTGVAGFLGSHLAEALLDRGHAVRGLDAFTPYYSRVQKEANLGSLRDRPGFTFQEGDLRTVDLPPLLGGCDWVFHQAAQPGVRASWDRGFALYAEHNLVATQRLLEACRAASIRRFVFASSSSVYGDVPEGEVGEDAPLRPLSPYGVTKLGAEHLVGVYGRAFGLPAVSLRYFTVCGARQRPDMAFHRILRSIHFGEPFPLHGDGGQERDFTAVSDAVAANLLAAERGRVGSVYNIGGGKPYPLNEAIRILEEAVGKRAVIRPVPPADGDPRRTAADLTRAREDLGYEPSVPLEAALREEAAWFAGPGGPAASASRGGAA
jgi:nucleoside-diphosphate-sugar epimerase